MTRRLRGINRFGWKDERVASDGIKTTHGIKVESAWSVTNLVGKGNTEFEMFLIETRTRAPARNSVGMVCVRASIRVSKRGEKKLDRSRTRGTVARDFVRS